MEATKQPGIRFVRVFLSKLRFELPEVPPKEFKYNFSFLDSHKIEGNSLICTIAIELYDKFQVELTGLFEIIEGAENMSLEQFAKVNAPALMMPFAREIISNITSRTPLPHLLLPPINIIAIKNKTIEEKKP
ncbi:MAG: protein-export chaperone SecB [Candidatus Omnitrophota bacterium]|jgi:preprotein translocase subunit SecB